MLAPFRPRITATDCFPSEKPDGVERLLPAEALDDILPEIDQLILAAPLNEQTCGMFDAERLARLPEGALLVNVARGRLVVEDDLVAALDSGKLAGAGVDVTEVEPLPVESRLWDQPNVIITPHVGGQAASRIDDMTRLFCENLRRFFRNRTLQNLVDKRLGFPVRSTPLGATAPSSSGR